MFPTYFYTPVPNSSVPLNLMNLMSGAGNEINSSSADMPTQLASFLLSSGLSSAQPSSYLLPGALPVQLPPVNNQLAFVDVDTSAADSLLLYLAGLQQQRLQNSELLAAEAVKNEDAHTIVRAPVLYETAKPQEGGKKEGPSPPDVIVASYAAAARTAAIACQQPLSNAAELFLSAAPLTVSSGTGTVTKSRMRKAKASRLQLGSTLANATASAAATSSPQFQTRHSNTAASSNSGGKPLSWNSAWVRILDRQTDVVVYISPGGARLKSLAKLRAYINFCLPESQASAISDECIAANFCFDASRDSRLVASPNDSIFVFPEPPVVSKSTTVDSFPFKGVNAITKTSSSTNTQITTASDPIVSSTCEDIARIKRPALPSDANEASSDQQNSLSVPEESPTKRTKKEATAPLSTLSTPDSLETSQSSPLPPTTTTATTSSVQYGDSKQQLSTEPVKPLTPPTSSEAMVENGLVISSSKDSIVSVPQDSVAPNITDSLTTTPTFVTRGGVEVDGPSVVSSVIPPFPSSITSSVVRTPSTNSDVLKALSIAAAANRSQQQANGLVAYLAQQQAQQQQQQLVAASLWSKIIQLQQPQPAGVAWPFVSEDGTLQQHLQVSAAMERMQRQQQLAALLQLQQQQQAQAAAAQQQLQLQQQLQAYATALQQVQQLTGANMTQGPH